MMAVCDTKANGGLSHLVEAATVLAQLNASAPPSDDHQPAKAAVVSEDDEKKAFPAPTRPNYPRKEIFPQRLMAILNDASLSDTVTWLPHGRSFVIIRPDVFTEEVLPKYLPAVDARASTKYPSFTRKLNRW